MTREPQKILVVDDLPDWRRTLSGLLADAGYDVMVTDSATGALRLLETERFDLAVVDIRLDETGEGNVEGLSLAKKIREQWPSVRVVIITGYGTPDIMRQALKPDIQGQKLAVDYIPKTQTGELVQIAQRALAQ